ncbi:MAG: hypothetical protein ACE5DK_12150, partial [Paracoccaceae bacterium]
DRDLHAIAHAAASARSESRARALEAKITHHAETLARRFDRVENLLITHEGLPGPLPGRKQMKGLYPQAQLIVPAIVAGLCASGAEVTVVFYKRRFRDWQASLYRYRFRDHPERGYNPGRFAARTGLPQGWDDVLGRLRDALRETEFSVVSFEKDRKNGLLGRALYRIWGLSDAEISRLRRLAPRNVSREKTRADHEFGT